MPTLHLSADLLSLKKDKISHFLTDFSKKDSTLSKNIKFCIKILMQFHKNEEKVKIAERCFCCFTCYRSKRRKEGRRLGCRICRKCSTVLWHIFGYFLWDIRQKLRVDWLIGGGGHSGTTSILGAHLGKNQL